LDNPSLRVVLPLASNLKKKKKKKEKKKRKEKERRVKSDYSIVLVPNNKKMAQQICPLSSRNSFLKK
jgi:hypothetical protein